MSAGALPRPLAGKLAVVTGTGGLGLEAAADFAGAGAEVILAGRNAQKGQEAVAAIQARHPDARVRFEVLDLASLASVALFAAQMKTAAAAIDILVCNAGIMSPPKRRTTADGHELQFGVNYLGHFALVGHLLPLLRTSGGASVVNVTSLAHRYGKLDFDDLQSERHYSPGNAYCVSKLAQATFARELQRRSDKGGWALKSTAAHPGFARTNLFLGDGANTGLLKSIGVGVAGRVLGQSAVAGAAPIIFAATAPEALGGGFYGPTGFLEMKGPAGRCQFSRAALDPVAAALLWGISEELAGVRFPDPTEAGAGSSKPGQDGLQDAPTG